MGCFMRMVQLRPTHSVYFGLKRSQSVIFHGLSRRRPNVYGVRVAGFGCQAFFLQSFMQYNVLIPYCSNRLRLATVL